MGAFNWKPIETMSENDKYKGSYLLHGPELVDLDFNPQGVERGYWQDGSGWIIPGWDANNDLYYNRITQPTHYAEVPSGPFSEIP